MTSTSGARVRGRAQGPRVFGEQMGARDSGGLRARPAGFPGRAAGGHVGARRAVAALGLRGGGGGRAEECRRAAGGAAPPPGAARAGRRRERAGRGRARESGRAAGGPRQGVAAGRTGPRGRWAAVGSCCPSLETPRTWPGRPPPPAGTGRGARDGEAAAGPVEWSRVDARCPPRRPHPGGPPAGTCAGPLLSPAVGVRQRLRVRDLDARGSAGG